MGKGKNKKKKKNKDDQLPTHLAGVHLPAELREIAATATELMRHPFVSNLAVKAAAGAMGQRLLDEVKGAADLKNPKKTNTKVVAGAGAD